LREGSARHRYPGAVRREFFDLVERLAPHVRQDLRDAVMPVYRDLLNEMRAANRIDWDPERLPLPFKPCEDYDETLAVEFLGLDAWFWKALEAADPLVEPLREALEKWADRHWINTRWVLNTALITLSAWAMQPKMQEPAWYVDDQYWGPDAALGADQIVVELPGVGELGKWTRETFRKEIVTDVEKAIDEHFDGIERVARERNIPSTQEGAKTEHVEWLVQRQVLGESIESIRKGASRTWPTVQEAIDGLGTYLQLPEREPARPGRPRRE
jgi:hypothetical protein